MKIFQTTGSNHSHRHHKKKAKRTKKTIAYQFRQIILGIINIPCVLLFMYKHCNLICIRGRLKKVVATNQYLWFYDYYESISDFTEKQKNQPMAESPLTELWSEFYYFFEFCVSR